MYSIHANCPEGKRFLYLTSPADITSGTDYRAALAAAKKRFPELRVFDTARELADVADWLRRWPHLLPQIDALVAVPRSDGSISYECGVAVLDFASMQLHGVPAPFAPPGLVRVSDVPDLFVFEAGYLKRLQRFSIATDGTHSRMAFVSAMPLLRSGLRQVGRLWQ